MKKMKLMFYVIFAFMLIIPFGVKAEETEDPSIGIICNPLDTADAEGTKCFIEAPYNGSDLDKYTIYLTENVNEGAESYLAISQIANSNSCDGDKCHQGFTVKLANGKTIATDSGISMKASYTPDNGTTVKYKKFTLEVKAGTSGGNGGGSGEQGGQSGEQEEQGDQSGEGGSSNTVPSTKEETSVNPDTADMNIVQLSVLSILFAGIAVLSYKKVIKNNN